LSGIGARIRELRNSIDIGLKPLARQVGITHSHLSRVERGEVQPSAELLDRLADALGVSAEEFRLQAGIVPEDIAQVFLKHPREAALVVRETFIPYQAKRRPTTSVRPRAPSRRRGPRPLFATDLGNLYQADCFDFLGTFEDGSVDMVFADPPFNLGKDYGKGISDRRKDEDYLTWSRDWLMESIRVLSPGGALLVFNLPKWLIHYGAVLEYHGMQFRHWIACRMPKSLPIPGRLSPAHYGLLYYTKGKPRAFNKVYVPIPVCRHCGGDIRDYGGHRKFLNEKGLNLMDVWDAPEEAWTTIDDGSPMSRRLWREADEIWDDIPPVRHSKYKLRSANALAPIMLERIIAFSTNRGDMVVDPFAGTGTTLYAAEKLGRRWAGCDIGDLKPAIRRLQEFKEGRHEEWETARGGATKSNGRHQLSLLAEG
jgi:site-specific DNA-methyltransferase (adenine-specific)